MRSEVLTWFDVMKNGATTPPLRRPRSDNTVRLQLHWSLPVLQAWAASGHTSLREITKTMVLDVLPASGNPRSTTGQGLKSIFRLLKARNVIFTGPLASGEDGRTRRPQLVPLDLTRHRTKPSFPTTLLGPPLSRSSPSTACGSVTCSDCG